VTVGFRSLAVVKQRLDFARQLVRKVFRQACLPRARHAAINFVTLSVVQSGFRPAVRELRFISRAAISFIAAASRRRSVAGGRGSRDPQDTAAHRGARTSVHRWRRWACPL
jgi:hypothetical protein